MWEYVKNEANFMKANLDLAITQHRTVLILAGVGDVIIFGLVVYWFASK